MTQSSFPLDDNNFPHPPKGEQEVILICNTALKRLEAISMSNIYLEFAKNLVVQGLRQLRLTCHEHLEDFGFVVTK